MTASICVHQIATDALPLLEPRVWREDVLRRHRVGERIVTLFGRRLTERVLLTAVFRTAAGALDVTRANILAQSGYHELTSEVPALHCFERELHEQTGIRVAAHPWLKPIRYEGQCQADMAAYPFYAIEGKEVHEVAVGPIHAGVIEPGSFRFMCAGEQVLHLEIQLGYQHRGVERRLLEGEPRRLGPLVETIAGDTSVAHAWAYCAALERLAGRAMPLELEVGRAGARALERIGMHLAGLAGLAADVGFLQAAAGYGRLRTLAINTTLRLCGSRFGRGAVRLGGSGMALASDVRREVAGSIALLRNDLAILDADFYGAKTVQHRLQGTGILTGAQAVELGLVGPAARASGVAIDARQGWASGVYHALPIAPQRGEEGDCWARARIRSAEMTAALDWLGRALDAYSSWGGARIPLGPLAPKQLVFALVEGWRGEVVHGLETDERGGLVHYKVQDPSLRNWMGLALAVRGNEISDFPICNKSFDLSYCGNDL